MIKEISTTCRICNNKNLKEIINLGETTPANNFISSDSLNIYEKYPLILDFCNKCFCLQLRHILDVDVLYKDYSYITPKSESLSTQYQNILNYLKKNFSSLENMNVLEVGSNNGELLNFLKEHVGAVLGVDPAENIVSIAKEKGIDSVCNFFNKDSAKSISSEREFKADIILARHMFAHNPRPGEILEGFKEIIKSSPDSIIMIENAYAIDTFLNGEFDQVYHEHMFYYSILSMKSLLDLHELYLHDIFFSPIHGGSVVFVASLNQRKISTLLSKTLKNEKALFRDNKVLDDFKKSTLILKDTLSKYINNSVEKGLNIALYGAPAKSFTLLSFLNFDNTHIKFCVDTTPTKIGKVFPLLDIPIISEEELNREQYDEILVGAWNYREEILRKSKKIFKPGTKLIFPLPNFEIIQV